MTDRLTDEAVAELVKQLEGAAKAHSHNTCFVDGFTAETASEAAAAIEDLRARLTAAERERDEASANFANCTILWHQDRDRTEDRIAKLEADNVTLRDALQPFAELFVFVLPDHEMCPDDAVVFKSKTGRGITYGHFRAARAALEGQP